MKRPIEEPCRALLAALMATLCLSSAMAAEPRVLVLNEAHAPLDPGWK